MLERDVAPGIHRVEDAYSNWYIVTGGPGVTVVDTGVASSWGSFLEAMRSLGLAREDVAAVLLTHGHLDHLGFAGRAQTDLGVPVWAHEREVGLIRRPYRYKHETSPLRHALDPGALRVGLALLGAGVLWPSRIGEVRTFSGGRLAVPGGPEVVFTPGHTDGHCALHFRDRDALISGDALVTFDPYTGGRGPRLMARAATADSVQALESLGAIGATGARVVLPGHGEPWREGAAEAARLAREGAGER